SVPYWWWDFCSLMMKERLYVGILRERHSDHIVLSNGMVMFLLDGVCRSRGHWKEPDRHLHGSRRQDVGDCCPAQPGLAPPCARRSVARRLSVACRGLSRKSLFSIVLDLPA